MTTGGVDDHVGGGTERPASEYAELWRELTPQVLGALARRYGHFDLAEESVQEALLAASRQWPEDGLPDNPRAWLITVASRRLTDQLRSEEARKRREDTVTAWSVAEPEPDAADDHATAYDDTLVLLLMCCHPSLAPPAQVALTLRAVGGLTTEEIARAFLVPTTTMAQRISRAKQRIRADGSRFELPTASELHARVTALLHVIYLVFNEGYTSTFGDQLQRTDLTAESIRLARLLHRQLPNDGEVTGLLALLLLTDARRPARTGPEGRLVPLAEQDRGRWNTSAIEEGSALVSDALAHTALGPYQLQAAIAAVHDEAASAADTEWVQILALYELLMHIQPNPMVALNHAVAVAMVRGPEAGLDALDGLRGDDRVAGHHRLYAVRAHLLELTGNLDAARAAYVAAARLTTSLPEQEYLSERATRLEVS